jgi:hypothetical protein
VSTRTMPVRQSTALQPVFGRSNSYACPGRAFGPFAVATGVGTKIGEGINWLTGRESPDKNVHTHVNVGDLVSAGSAFDPRGQLDARFRPGGTSLNPVRTSSSVFVS